MDPKSGSQTPAAKPVSGHRVGTDDFLFGALLGEGAYARVHHARGKENGHDYAVKIMEKRFIKKEHKAGAPFSLSPPCSRPRTSPRFTHTPVPRASPPASATLLAPFRRADPLCDDGAQHHV